jgi:uncharacterized protein DUF222
MTASSAREPFEWDEDPAWSRPDPMTAEEREEWLDRLAGADEPPDLDDEEDWEDSEPLTADELAEVEKAAGDELLAVEVATTGRRGPGQPGSARVFPGESSSRAAAFGPGMALDVLPGCAGLAVAADAAAGEDDGFAGVSDAELIGVVCGWDRVEAHAAARKLAAAAELIRRNPEPGSELAGPARMPVIWDEFATDQLAYALAESRGHAESLLGMAQFLQTHLPGTMAAFLDGTISRHKAGLIAHATQFLDPAEARAAEGKVLDRAGRLTPRALRAAIARAVMEVAPEKARKRREAAAARDARVERWAEDSGNAALMGRELPPDEALAADQRITAWARELKAAGLDGDMDMLRARAYLDLLLGKDSRPRPVGGGDAPPPSPGPAGGAVPVPAGFAGQVTLTAPLATLARLADRPGETTGSSSTRNGRSTSFPTAPSAGPPRPDAATTPNPPGIRSRACGERPRIRRCRGRHAYCQARRLAWLDVSQPEERSLSGRIFDDLPQRQQPVAHGRAPDHCELAFFLIGQAKMGTGGTAQDEYVITAVHEVVRVDDIVRERGHVSVPRVAVCFPAGHRGLLENLEPMAG